MENHSAIKKYKLRLQRWLSQVLGKPEDLSSIPGTRPTQELGSGSTLATRPTHCHPGAGEGRLSAV